MLRGSIQFIAVFCLVLYIRPFYGFSWEVYIRPAGGQRALSTMMLNLLPQLYLFNRSRVAFGKCRLDIVDPYTIALAHVIYGKPER